MVNEGGAGVGDGDGKYEEVSIGGGRMNSTLLCEDLFDRSCRFAAEIW